MLKTIFKVGGQTYSYDGVGQKAASAALKAFPKEVVLLHGFMVNDVFIRYKGGSI